MTSPLAISAIAFGLGVAAFVALLLARRAHRATKDVARVEAEERVAPLALQLLDLDEHDAQALSRVLSRYARRVTGSSRQRIASFSEASGQVARGIDKLARGRRVWHRAEAAFRLGDLGSVSAAPGLIGALDEGDRDVRAAAARSLGKVGGEGAVVHLIAAFASASVPRAVAAQALVEIGDVAVPELRRLATSDDDAVRAAAIEMVGLLGAASDAETPLAGLRDPAAEVRGRSARALARLGAHRAAEGLRVALDDRVPFVRTAAAHALGVVGDRAAVPALLRQARVDAFEPARAAAQAVARIAPEMLMDEATRADAGSHLVEAGGLMALNALKQPSYLGPSMEGVP